MPCEASLRPVYRAILLLLLSASAACSRPSPRAANPTRVLDERRAVQVIAETFAEESATPGSGPDLELAPLRRLQVDVWANGRRFGVAYLTQKEREGLRDVLPARDPKMGDALQLVSGIGGDADARVCVLYDSDYLYDDLVGESHEKSTLTAELKLKRDVRDFLAITRRENMK
ncbi:MAG TPA: hypothetical protein VFQ61_00290 [Polyangiaceae bacterium]|nr:hypothetical protein [Polyangiaceae bacterium]